jgi:flagellar motility protein MotE (MotC chaperone)
MKKILTSKWVALGVGMAGFAATLLLYPSSKVVHSPAGGTNVVQGTNVAAHAATNDHASVETIPVQSVVAPLIQLASSDVGEPGSRSFNNPDVNRLIEELKREKNVLMAKEKELEELRRRIALEKAEFGSMTQEVMQFKAALERTLTNQLTLIYRTETNKLQELANIYTNMPPQNAVAILNQMTVDDVAKILQFMPLRNQSSLLENFATNELVKPVGKATEISQRMRKVSAEIDLPQLKK